MAVDFLARPGRHRVKVLSESTLADGRIERTVQLRGDIQTFPDADGKRVAVDSKMTRLSGPDRWVWAGMPIQTTWDADRGRLTTVTPSGSRTHLDIAKVNGVAVSGPFATELLTDEPGVRVTLTPDVQLVVRVRSDMVKSDIVLLSASALGVGNTFSVEWTYDRVNANTDGLTWAGAYVQFPVPIPVTTMDTGTTLRHEFIYDRGVFPLVLDPTETVGENTGDTHTQTLHDTELRTFIFGGANDEDFNFGALSPVGSGRWTFVGVTREVEYIAYTDIVGAIGAGATVTAMSFFLYKDEAADPLDLQKATTTLHAYRLLSGNTGWWPEGAGTGAATAASGEPDCLHREHDGTTWLGGGGANKCVRTTNDREATSMGNVVVLDTDLNAYVEIVFSASEARALYDSNAGIVILPSEWTSGQNVQFPSSEGSDAQRPYFEITYTVSATIRTVQLRSALRTVQLPANERTLQVAA